MASVGKVTDIRLLVTDLARARDFYRDVLELELRVEVPQTYAEFITDGATLAIYRVDLMSERIGERWVGPAGGAVVCLEVEDADVTFDAVVGRGAIAVREPHDERSWYLRVAHVADPDGHVIELDQRLRADRPTSA